MKRQEKDIYEWAHESGLQAGEPRPPTPWLKSIDKAAKSTNVKPADVRFEIQHYAKRNALAHPLIFTHC